MVDRPIRCLVSNGTILSDKNYIRCVLRSTRLHVIFSYQFNFPALQALPLSQHSIPQPKYGILRTWCDKKLKNLRSHTSVRCRSHSNMSRILSRQKQLITYITSSVIGRKRDRFQTSHIVVSYKCLSGIYYSET